MAALFRPSSVVPASSISPVAILMTWTALLTTSAGRLWRIDIFRRRPCRYAQHAINCRRCRRSEATPRNVAHEETVGQRDQRDHEGQPVP